MTPVSVRLDDEAIERIEALCADAGPLGTSVDRSVMVRAIVMRGLPLAEGEADRARKARAKGGRR